MTELVYSDLEDEFEKLSQNNESPVHVRKTFSNFIELTQKLTETMRKEFKDLTGNNWTCKEFVLWNNHTELFKKLRNYNYHEYPTLVNVKHIESIPINIDGKNCLMELVVDWKVEDHTADEIPTIMQLEEILLMNGLETVNIAEYNNRTIRFEYSIDTCSDEIEKILGSLSERDIHKLSRECMNILREYYKFYKQRFEDKINKVV